MSNKYIAVLSTAVLPTDGTFRIITLAGSDREEAQKAMSGVPHYVGHPDTKILVEGCGAVQSTSKLFLGLQPGESALCVPIRQGMSTRRIEGFSAPHQEASWDTIELRVLTRLE